MKMTIDISQAEVSKMLREVRFWQARKRAQIIDLIKETADEIAKQAEANAPEETGKLKKKIRTLLKAVASDLSGVVVADTFYAKWIELGTQSASAHPFMMPAFEAAIPGFLSKLRTILSK